jgi:2-oxoisovalerate dehydrogenase E2 component (dihydrolipoyl transacylase)
MGAYLFRLPDLGEGTVEAEIVAWHVKPGDEVEEDQPMLEVMTDKATVEITSPVTGRVVSVHGELGKAAAVGSTLVEFATGEAENTVGVEEPPPVAAAVPAAEPVGDLNRAPAFHYREGGKPTASPAVRRQASELGIDLKSIAGTGPGGRILREDLQAPSAPPPQPQKPVAVPVPVTAGDAIEEVRIIGLRRKIAEKMQEAKRRIPHFAYIEEVDVTALEDLRAHLNATKSVERPKLTLLPFLITALVRALPLYPQINARYDDEAGILRRYGAVHLGMATQTPGGLIVPVIRYAQQRDIWALAVEIARLAKATRDGTATRDELSGSTLTLTSLGPLGGIAHTPVINHPEVAIIGPNKIVERPVVRNGQIVVRKMMNISASFDHRVVDGFDAASFIQVVKSLLENPATLFMP